MSDSIPSSSRTQDTGIGTTKEAVPVTATPRQSSEYRVTCVSCRQRKVKCSKTHPCVACDRSGLSCVFPDRARLPRGRKRGSKATNGEILKRLNKLEELLAQSKSTQEGEAGQNSQDGESAGRTPETNSPKNDNPSRTGSIGGKENKAAGKEEGAGGLDRYLGSQFWNSLSNEMEGLRQTLNDDSDDDEEPTTSTPESDTSHHTWMFGNTPDAQPLRSLHPTPSQISILCTLYLRNCDPVYKVLHRPTLLRQVRAASANLDDIPGGKGMEALLFSMYYCAVISLAPEQCLQMFQCERDLILTKYRRGVEIALGKADFLNSTEVVTLQALTLFLFCVRVQDDTRFCWTLTGVAVRIAHALGLNRERANAVYSPFLSEMRRRLWWMICMLDVRSSEDRGSDNMVLEGTFDTRKPMNINDEDMDVESQVITERTGFTEMTFSLISHDVSVVVRRFNYAPLGIGNEEHPLSLTFEEKARMITECQRHIENKYLIHCNITNPIAFTATAVARLIMSRMWLSLYHPFPQEVRQPPQGAITKDRLLQTAVEVLEYAHLLEREPGLAQWRWILGTWVQWHALAVTLAALCVQNQGPLVVRAWRIVDLVYEGWAERVADSAKGMLWRPIKKLMGKAQTNRRSGTQMLDVLMIDDKGYSSGGVTNSQPLPLDMPLINNLQIPDVFPESSSGFLPVGEMLPNGAIQLGLPPYQLDPNQQYLPDIPLPSADAGLIDSINWTDWDEFMRDFEMEQSGPGGAGKVQQDLHYPLW